MVLGLSGRTTTSERTWVLSPSSFISTPPCAASSSSAAKSAPARSAGRETETRSPGPASRRPELALSPDWSGRLRPAQEPIPAPPLEPPALCSPNSDATFAAIEIPYSRRSSRPDGPAWYSLTKSPPGPKRSSGEPEPDERACVTNPKGMTTLPTGDPDSRPGPKAMPFSESRAGSPLEISLSRVPVESRTPQRVGGEHSGDKGDWVPPLVPDARRSPTGWAYWARELDRSALVVERRNPSVGLFGIR